MQRKKVDDLFFLYNCENWLKNVMVYYDIGLVLFIFLHKHSHKWIIHHKSQHGRESCILSLSYILFKQRSLQYCSTHVTWKHVTRAAELLLTVQTSARTDLQV